MTTVLALLAATYGVAMALGPVLQIREMRRLRSSHAVSVGFLWVLVPGFLLWAAYGVAIGSPALVVPNVVAVVVALATIAVALSYRR